MFKACGYLISTLSVALLGFVAWDGAKDDPALIGALLLGMFLSVVGMAVRFVSHLREK